MYLDTRYEIHYLYLDTYLDTLYLDTAMHWCGEFAMVYCLVTMAGSVVAVVCCVVAKVQSG